MSEKKTTPKQYRVYNETAQAISALQEKTGMTTADLMKAMQETFEKVGSDEVSRDKVKGRIITVQEHFTAVVAELEAMAQDLTATHESDSQKNMELTEEVQRLKAENEGLGKELAELKKKLEQAEQVSKEWDKERQELKAENEKLKNTIMAKLEKL